MRQRRDRKVSRASAGRVQPRAVSLVESNSRGQGTFLPRLRASSAPLRLRGETNRSENQDVLLRYDDRLTAAGASSTYS